MEDLLKFLATTVKRDKLLHFFYGYWIVAITSAVISLGVAIVVIFIIAIGKEFYDARVPNHTSDWKDFVYTILPLVGFYIN